MLATKIPSGLRTAFMVAAAAVIMAGCTASGPRALLKGDAALRDGKPDVAIGYLKEATDQLPNEPRAWNMLGLAYHANGQRQLAAEAYRRALSLDQSNLVSVAHFNLGCLLLESGDAANAANELRAFTMTTNSAAAWIKLGQAQSRLRQYDQAERSLATAMRLDRTNPESYNNLGVVYARWNRPRDAEKYINGALQLNPKYGPALLNSALLAHQHPNTRQVALQRYRAYLALEPRPADWDRVNGIARQLEAELAPKPAPAPAPQASVQLAPTNIAASVAAPAALTAPMRPAATAVPPVMAAAPVSARTNPVPTVAPVTNPLRVASAPAPSSVPAVSVPPSINPPATTQVAQAAAPAAVSAPRPAPQTNAAPRVAIAAPAPEAAAPRMAATGTGANVAQPAPASAPAVVPTAPPVTVSVATSAPVVAAAPITRAPRPAAPATNAAPVRPAAAAVTPEPAPADPALAANPERPGFLSRLNPFRNRSEQSPGAETGRVVVARAPAPAETLGSTGAAAVPAGHYPYTNPARPAAGRRGDSERLVNEALKAQRAGSTNQALTQYAAAIAADPSYINAQYNYALLMQQMGDFARALPAWETVLALEPDSVTARHNFALALKQANYPYEAAAELQRIIAAHPKDASAHLTLANLYAQQLGDARRARDHYMKVLELEPRNAQASSIRFWLAANP